MEKEPTNPIESEDMPLNKEERLERLAEMVNNGDLKAEIDEAIGYDPDLMVD
ncbi:MAG: hypothetical protein U5L95_04235 [Candidatus Saccharibacteria bacterium]|nr:hypothetical protein [Candidatus Saccharibacteria bacterium]